MRNLIFGIFILSTSPGWPFTLQEAVSMALAKANLLQQSQIDYQKSEAAVTQARAAFLPSLDLNAAYAYNSEDPRLRASDWDSSAGIVLSENLFDHGVSLYTYDLSKVHRKLAKLEFQRQRSTAILTAIQLYFEGLRTQQVQELQNKNTEQVEQVYKLVNSQFRQGMRPRSDFLRIQSQYQRSLLAQTSAQLESLRAFQALKVYLDMKFDPGPLENYSGLPNLTVSPGSIYEAEKRKFNMEMRDFIEKLAKVEVYPQLNLYSKLGYGSDTYYQTGQRWGDNERSFLTAGLTFTWNIWDWGKRSAAVQNAKLESLKSESQSTFEERQALARIAELEQQLKIIQKQYGISESLLKIEILNYALMERAYKEGRSSYLDFSTSLSNLLLARTQKIQMEHQLILTSFELGHRKGYLDESSLK